MHRSRKIDDGKAIVSYDQIDKGLTTAQFHLTAASGGCVGRLVCCFCWWRACVSGIAFLIGWLMTLGRRLWQMLRGRWELLRQCQRPATSV